MKNHFYFAYGSNMNPDRIRERIPQARVIGKAYIKGWKIKERLYADIDRRLGGRVEGVLYLISDSELSRLDVYEGYPNIYTSFEVNAYLDEKHKVYAVTYAMTKTTKKEREGRPYPLGYRLMCSYGAKLYGVKDSFARAGDPPYIPLVGRLRSAKSRAEILHAKKMAMLNLEG